MPEVVASVYCAGVTVEQYKELSGSDMPFLCVTCCRSHHERQISELRAEVEALRCELSELRSQIRSRPQIPSNMAEDCSRGGTVSENGASGKLAEKKGRSTRHGAKRVTKLVLRDHVTEDRPRAREIAGARDKSKVKTKVVGARRVWGTLRACTVSTVRSVIERICSNNTIRLKQKTSERPGQSPVWWFVIHDSEESLEVLDSKWNLVHVQTNWKLENCYQTSDSCLQNESSTPPTAMLPAPAMSPVTTSSLTTSNDVIAPDTDSVDVPCNDPTTGSILSGEELLNSGNSEHATFLAQD